MQMNLSQINSVCRVTPQKPVRSLQELTLEVPEEILSAKRVSGKFGAQILLELKESIVFLPQRVTDAIAPYVDALKGYRIVFHGTRQFNSHYYHHQQADFEFLEPLENVQGYIVNNEFTVKELAIYDGKDLKSYLFKPTVNYHDLNTTDRKTANYLYHNIHGIPYESGDVDYSEIHEILENNLSSIDMVFVKGQAKAGCWCS
ncbi:hypothetical protein ABEB36_000404 [Hypothenemus hampei]|uniref:Uncharacterized protein n=1 Tax=Hypothenemus hampei TaxID=57062 RepID=A0ABD1FB37_HYPHA